MAMRDRSTHKTVYSAKYHLIWCPKDRRRVLVDCVEERLKAVIAEVAAEVGAAVIEVEVLAEVPPTVPLPKFVGLLKGRSQRLLRMQCPRLRRLPALWSPPWFGSTVGGASLAVVRRDVENQKATARR
jgi:putative transposase